MNKLVITISREFGSGGRLVGERLARELGFAFYDKALIYLAVSKCGFDPATIEKAEEEAANKLLFNLSLGGYVAGGGFPYLHVPLSDQIFFAQSKVIEELAEQGNCVVIGRCANYVLRDRPGRVRVFVHAEAEDKLRRVVDEYGVPPEEAGTRMAKVDKARANYHEYYTEQAWGSAKIYDLTVNTSFTGIDGAVRVIRTLVGR